MNNNIRKVLITGGAGYIGSVLTRMLLYSGYKVCVLDNLSYGGESLLGIWSHPNFNFIKADIRDIKKTPSLLDDVDAVIHLAAIVGDPACAKEPEKAKEINLNGSLLLLENSKKHNVSRFIFASTCSNYGKMKDPECLIDEESELSPLSLYAQTKVKVEEAILNGSSKKDFHPTVLRFATAYGVSPRMRFDLTVNEFTMEMLTKKHLVVYGSEFWRPYAHIRDIAAAILLALKQPGEKVAGAVLNVGSTQENYQKQQIVDLIKTHAKDAVVEYVHKEEDPRDYRVCFDKIKQCIGFEPRFSVKDGIAEVARLINKGILTDFNNPRYSNIADKR